MDVLLLILLKQLFLLRLLVFLLYLAVKTSSGFQSLPSILWETELSMPSFQKGELRRAEFASRHKICSSSEILVGVKC